MLTATVVVTVNWRGFITFKKQHNLSSYGICGMVGPDFQKRVTDWIFLPSILFFSLKVLLISSLFALSLLYKQSHYCSSKVLSSLLVWLLFLFYSLHRETWTGNACNIWVPAHLFGLEKSMGLCDFCVLLYNHCIPATALQHTDLRFNLYFSKNFVCVNSVTR